MRDSAVLSILGAASLWLRTACALTPPPPLAPPLVFEEQAVNDALRVALLDDEEPLTGVGYFDQYIDHDNPGLGTFPQTYWYNATFYKGPGSPIILFTPGEIAAAGYTGYLTDSAITGMIAKEVGGAVLVVEHRYWGNSTPYEIQTTKNLQYLDLEQSVADFVHFAQSVQLPFDTVGSSNAPDAVSP
jgi:hypothetical protein